MTFQRILAGVGGFSGQLNRNLLVWIREGLNMSLKTRDRANQMVSERSDYDDNADGWVYVIKCRYNQVEFFYVGSTYDLHRRIDDHIRKKDSIRLDLGGRRFEEVDAELISIDSIVSINFEPSGSHLSLHKAALKAHERRVFKEVILDKQTTDVYGGM